jgi:phenylacetate-CoA ligase
MKHTSFRQSVRHALGPIAPLIPDRLRFGNKYVKMAALLRKSESFDVTGLQQIQLFKLQDLLRHCWKNVPYYQESWKSRGIEIKNIVKLDDLQNFPFLTKKLIQENINKLKATNIPDRRKVLVTTGGSSGEPTQLYRHVNDNLETAFIADLWARVGCSLETRRMVLRGPILLSDKKWHWDLSDRTLTCSTYHFDDEHMQCYFNLLGYYRIEAIHGHVSSVATFAQFLIRNGLRYKLKAVLGASERVFEFQRELVKQAFDCRLFSWYGQTEQVVLAGEGISSQEYLIYPQYGVTELIDSFGKVITSPGKPGEIVGTGFNIYSMPLIRYRTGDIGVYSEEHYESGEPIYKKFKYIDGRSYEYVVLQDGVLVSLTGLIFGQHFACFERIIKMQLVQDFPGFLQIFIVADKRFNQEDENEIIQIIDRATDGRIKLTFNYVDNIRLTAQGKHRFLIQNISNKLTSA